MNNEENIEDYIEDYTIILNIPVTITYKDIVYNLDREQFLKLISFYEYEQCDCNFTINLLKHVLHNFIETAVIECEEIELLEMLEKVVADLKGKVENAN